MEKCHNVPVLYKHVRVETTALGSPQQDYDKKAIHKSVFFKI